MIRGQSRFGVSRRPLKLGAVPNCTVAPVISGTPSVGSTASCTTGTWLNIIGVAYAYQWLRDGAIIPSANASTYVFASADQGHNVTCAVTATNSTPAQGTALSNAIFLAAGGAPTISVAPKFISAPISGSTVTAPIVGMQLFIDVGTWTGSPTSFAWTIKAGGVAVPGATGTCSATGESFFLVTDQQIGLALTVEIVANNGVNSLAAASTSTSAVADIVL